VWDKLLSCWLLTQELSLRSCLGIFWLLFLILIKLALILSRSVLVLLVLGDEVVHVGLGLSELHLVHALASVPVEEGLSPEHSSELLGNSLKELLDGSGVADECGSHLETPWRDVANGSLNVVGDPLHEVGRVLVLDVEHLLIHLLHGHPAPEDSSHGEVPAVSGVETPSVSSSEFPS